MKRFVRIDKCNRDEEFSFMDTKLGTRYHLTEQEYQSLLDIILEHEAGKISFKPILEYERRVVIGDEEYDIELQEGQY